MGIVLGLTASVGKLELGSFVLEPLHHRETTRVASVRALTSRSPADYLRLTLHTRTRWILDPVGAVEQEHLVIREKVELK